MPARWSWLQGGTIRKRPTAKGLKRVIHIGRPARIDERFSLELRCGGDHRGGFQHAANAFEIGVVERSK